MRNVVALCVLAAATGMGLMRPESAQSQAPSATDGEQKVWVLMGDNSENGATYRVVRIPFGVWPTEAACKTEIERRYLEEVRRKGNAGAVERY
jgi:hypothetical protein